MPDAMSAAFAKLRRATGGLRHVVEGTSYGTPGAEGRQEDARPPQGGGDCGAVLRAEDKALLIEPAPEIYFETEHYRGWPVVLTKIDAISDAELRHWLEATGDREDDKGAGIVRDLPLGRREKIVEPGSERHDEAYGSNLQAPLYIRTVFNASSLVLKLTESLYMPRSFGLNRDPLSWVDLTFVR